VGRGVRPGHKARRRRIRSVRAAGLGGHSVCRKPISFSRTSQRKSHRLIGVARADQGTQLDHVCRRVGDLENGHLRPIVCCRGRSGRAVAATLYRNRIVDMQDDRAQQIGVLVGQFWNAFR